MGTTATFAPRIKRAVSALSNERAVSLVPDTNLTTSNGDDASGTAKLFLYASAVQGGGPWTVKSYTPTVAAMSATRKFVGSMGVNPTNNDVYVAYTGTDNSLRVIKFSGYNGSTDWTTTAEQIVVAADPTIANKYRAIDIDVTPQGNVAVIVYEAHFSSGQGSHVRVFVRNADAVTWRSAHEFQQFGSSFIRADSEDVSVSFDTDGVVSNVVKIALYWALASTTGDNGDFVREITYNVSTGTTNSATTVGEWFSGTNINQASGTRRGWLYGLASGKWLWASAVGSVAPFFESAKLTHNVFTGIQKNRISATTDAAQRKLQMFLDANGYAYVTTMYQDGNLLFVLAGQGQVTSRTTRALLMRYEAVNDTTCSYMDSSGRLWDADFNFLSPSSIGTGMGPIGVYGGGNKFLQSNFMDYPVLATYGTWGNGVSTSSLAQRRTARMVKEDTGATPQVVAPSGVQTNNRPTLRVFFQPAANYSNVRYRAEWTIASNGDFTTGTVKNIVQPYSDGQFVNSTNGTDIPNRMITYTLSQAESLFSGTWYIRARMRDDFNGVSAWTSDSGPTQSFTVSHPPIALPISPEPATLREYGTGDIVFTWNFQDTEPTDNQSAYRVIVQLVSDGTVVTDTGKVTSSSRSVTINISSTYQNTPLQWTVQLWDQDNVAGAASDPRIFTLAVAPTATAITPADAAVVTTALPTFSWSYSSPGLYLQRSFRVTVYDLTPNPDQVIADSGWTFSPATNYTFPAQILLNAGSYRWTIEVRDEVNLYDSDSNDFTTAWSEPVRPTITVVSDKFKNTVSWTNATQDVDWVTYRVYRKFMVPSDPILDLANTANTWVLVYETDVAQTNYSFADYTGPLNKPVTYLVVQLADRFGSLIESSLAAGTTVTQVGDRYFFIPEIPLGSIASFEGGSVNADSFTPEVETETLHVIGRGRQVQVGDDLGKTGSLSIRLRNAATARRDREFFETLASDDTGNVWMKSPFGDVLFVRIFPPSTNRVPGMGAADLVDMTIAYLEVFPEAQITRTV